MARQKIERLQNFAGKLISDISWRLQFHSMQFALTGYETLKNATLSLTSEATPDFAPRYEAAHAKRDVPSIPISHMISHRRSASTME